MKLSGVSGSRMVIGILELLIENQCQVPLFWNQAFSVPMSSTIIAKNDIAIEFILIVLITALTFSLAYHPYFFGDELVAYRLAIQHNYSFWLIFQSENAYKPRLIFNGILALLAKLQAGRLVHATLITVCMIWINILLYSVVRYLFRADRWLAWLLIATVLTSRYGMMLYFDYASGLIELLSTALLLSALLLAWLAWRGVFNWWYAVDALAAAILCIFVHERYVAGLLAVGFTIALAECAGPSAKRRIPVVGWALSLGAIPLFLFWIANTVIGSLPLTIGTSGQEVTLGSDTFWCMLTYSYNVFLGGNYGHEWFWGYYNYLNPIGKFLGWGTVVGTVAITVVIVLRKGVAWRSGWCAMSLFAVAIALIMIASLPGANRQEARWMFPVGILAAMAWIVILRGTWRHVIIAMILAVNLIYLLLGSHDSMAYLYASRAANSIAGSLLGIMPNGRSGIIVGNATDSWTIGGGSAIDMGFRQGDTFSKVNLKSAIHIDPFVAGNIFDPALYNFGLAFTGYGPHRTAQYRLVSVNTAMILTGVSDVDNLPVSAVLGNSETWSDWQWNTQPDQVNSAVILRVGIIGWRVVPSANLDGRLLVYHVRAQDGMQVPMRLQVNWHAKQDNRLLSTMIQVVYPNETWHSFAALLIAPPDADLGYVYATLHDGALGAVEIKSVELK